MDPPKSPTSQTSTVAPSPTSSTAPSAPNKVAEMVSSIPANIVDPFETVCAHFATTLKSSFRLHDNISVHLDDKLVNFVAENKFQHWSDEDKAAFLTALLPRKRMNDVLRPAAKQLVEIALDDSSDYVKMIASMILEFVNTGSLSTKPLQSHSSIQKFTTSLEEKFGPMHTAMHLPKNLLFLSKKSQKDYIPDGVASHPSVTFKDDYVVLDSEERYKTLYGVTKEDQLALETPLSGSSPVSATRHRAPSSLFIPVQQTAPSLSAPKPSMVQRLGSVPKGLKKGGKIKMMDEDEVDAAFAVQKRAEEGARAEKVNLKAEREAEKNAAREAKQKEMEEKRLRKLAAEEEKRAKLAEREARKRKVSVETEKNSKQAKLDEEPNSSQILSAASEPPQQPILSPSTSMSNQNLLSVQSTSISAQVQAQVAQVLEGATGLSEDDVETISLFLQGKYEIQEGKKLEFKLTERLFMDGEFVNGKKSSELKKYNLIYDFLERLFVYPETKMEKLKTKSIRDLKDTISRPTNFQHIGHADKGTVDIGEAIAKGDKDLIRSSTAYAAPGVNSLKKNALAGSTGLRGSLSITNLFSPLGGSSKKLHLDSKLGAAASANSPPTSETIDMLAGEIPNEPEEEEHSSPLESVKTAIQRLFDFKTRTTRRKVLHNALTSTKLSDSEKATLKQEYLLRESTVNKRKMSAQDFEFIKVLGHGGFGVVQLVREKAHGELLAMKMLAKTTTIERGQENHVKSERSLLSLASELSDWVVRLHYSFQDRDFLYFALDYMPGGDLLGLLIKMDIFPENFARFYFAEMVMAIEEVHKLGMIHRDIKPDNFLFDQFGHLKLADFGLATDAKASSQHGESNEVEEEAVGEGQPRRHMAYSVVGTNNYVAPEVLKGKGYDKSVDWWSAGVILFEMIYGYPTFSSSSSSSTKKKILDFKKYLVFPSSPESSDLVQNLISNLIDYPTTRLGRKMLPDPPKDRKELIKAMVKEGDASDIKKHPWFAGFRWVDIFLQKPPFVPQLQDGEDTGYFEEIDPKEIEELLRGFENKGSETKFEGFTYLAPSILDQAFEFDY